MILPALALLSAMGNAMPQPYVCDDPAFTFSVEGSRATLAGSVTAPQLGYTASFAPGGVTGGILAATLKLAQPAAAAAPFGRGLPALETLAVNHTFDWPAAAEGLRLSITGLAPAPRIVLCRPVRQG